MSLGPHIQPAQVEAIFAAMADSGVSLKTACEKAELAYSAVRKRIKDSEEITSIYAWAREDYAEYKVGSMNDIARSEADVARARLLCDNIKWEVAKVLPKVYGDKITTEHTGGVTLSVSNQEEAL